MTNLCIICIHYFDFYFYITFVECQDKYRFDVWHIQAAKSFNPLFFTVQCYAEHSTVMPL